MYYDERWIDGNLYYRTTPKGNWKPFTIKMLNERIKEREEEVLSLRHDIDFANELAEIYSNAETN